MGNNILEMRGIEKYFGGVHALSNMKLQVEKGEVHALLGENGAGKSTLIKILGGIFIPDKGEIIINGKLVNIRSVKDSQNNGVRIIHQEIALVPHLSVAENIFLGKEHISRIGLRKCWKMEKQAQDMLLRFGVDINVKTKIRKLSIAQQQIIEIIKAVSFDAKIIVMDEPTSSITESDVHKLYEIINNLKYSSVSVIFITHKIQELFDIADRITVLRDGEYIATRKTTETNKDELIKLMVGRELTKYYTRSSKATKKVILEAKALSKKGVFKDVSFKVRKGEVVGFAGLVGAGRSEIMEAIVGINPYESGHVFYKGGKKKYVKFSDAINDGISFITEDRKKTGLIMNNSVGFNILLCVLDQIIKGARVDSKKKYKIAYEFIEKLNIKTPSLQQNVSKLSGGNQQKTVIAKWLSTKPELLIMDEPTRGVDVGAKAEIYSIIDDLAKQGIAIIMISSELPEIINMADRIYTVCNGHINGELQKDDFDQEKIMHLVTGGVTNEYQSNVI